MFRDLDSESVIPLHASGMVEWARQRTTGQALVRAWTPPDQDSMESTYSVIEIVTDDMPFLVDSVTTELTRNGRAIYLVAHPQLAVTRADGELAEVHDIDVNAVTGGMIAESWMHIHIERDFVSNDLDALVPEIERVLSDVRKAVSDWSLMRKKAIEISGVLRREQLGTTR
jgi:glutamate dehydrogenase